MSLDVSLVSDEISIQGLNKDDSPVQKDYFNTPYLDILSFKLTASPSEKWIKTFKERAYGSMDSTIASTCVFEGSTLTLSTGKTYAKELQEFIDSLKKAFDAINEFLQIEQDEEAEKERELNDILDNLKF